jgi:hypothetical protein
MHIPAHAADSSCPQCAQVLVLPKQLDSVFKKKAIGFRVKKKAIGFLELLFDNQFHQSATN